MYFESTYFCLLLLNGSSYHYHTEYFSDTGNRIFTPPLQKISQSNIVGVANGGGGECVKDFRYHLMVLIINNGFVSSVHCSLYHYPPEYYMGAYCTFQMSLREIPDSTE